MVNSRELYVTFPPTNFYLLLTTTRAIEIVRKISETRVIRSLYMCLLLPLAVSRNSVSHVSSEPLSSFRGEFMNIEPLFLRATTLEKRYPTVSLRRNPKILSGKIVEEGIGDKRNG